jgi:hypothetical protein
MPADICDAIYFMNGTLARQLKDDIASINMT